MLTRKQILTDHKKMKKVLPLLLAAVLLAGCGEAGGNAGTAQTGSGADSVSGTTQTSSSEGSGSGIAQSGSGSGNQFTAAGDSSEAVSAVSGRTEGSGDSEDAYIVTEGISDAPAVGDLTCSGKLRLDYAERFNVYYYDGGYKLFAVSDTEGNTTDYLLIPEGKEAPAGLSDDIITVQAPLDHIYMAASGSMCFFPALGCLDDVTTTAIDRDGWKIQEPIDALDDGRMKYAGKYSEPDYELLLNDGCDAAIESTMILHSPETQEMLQDLGIPVIIDRCSYEQDPFGRMEWVKFYGALMRKEQEADDYFSQEIDSLGDYKSYQDTGKTAAFFSVNSAGQIMARRSDDFIPNLMKMAGGTYVFSDLKNPAGDSAIVNMTMEEFYNESKDADYLIYNATIEAPLTGIKDLESKSSLFSDFKAVQNGNVWQVDNTWYQATDHVGELLTDFHLMFTGGDAEQMTFLTKLS